MLFPSPCFPYVPGISLKLLLCSFRPDPIFESKLDEKDVLLETLQQPWQVQEKAMDTDINALQWVEDLEQRVIAADLLLKVRTTSFFVCLLGSASDATATAETLLGLAYSTLFN